MRIAYVGNFKPSFSTENHVRLSLVELGHEVVGLQEDVVSFGKVRQHALQSDLLLHTTTWDTLPHEEMRALFDECSSAGVPTVGYHLDLFWGIARGGRQWLDEPMFRSAWYFSTDGDHQEDWNRVGVNHVWLPAGVYGRECDPGRARREYVCDVAFVGSDGRGYHPEWPYRRQLCRHLERAYAGRYHNPGGLEPKLREGALNDFYASAKVTVGDSLALHREDSHYWSDRVYEATGRGGLLVMPRMHALSDEFEGALPMYDWGDWQQLDWLISHFLAKPEVRAAHKQRCWEITTSRYTYKHRIQTVLETIT